MSSIAYLVVLIGFTKIILFDMADEFGLRDETGNMVYSFRFWLFALLIVSFCAAVYILLDVMLEDLAYLVILPVLLTRAGLELLDITISELAEKTVSEYYQTVRNFYFDYLSQLQLFYCRHMKQRVKNILFFLSIDFPCLIPCRKF